jgi:hypothetical protein
LRLSRLAKLKELGLIAPDVSHPKAPIFNRDEGLMSFMSGQVVPHPMVSAYGTEEWANLSEEEQQLSQRKMEVS